jgi:hypothetical protein
MWRESPKTHPPAVFVRNKRIAPMSDYRAADQINKKKLRETFGDYFERYETLY